MSFYRGWHESCQEKGEQRAHLSGDESWARRGKNLINERTISKHEEKQMDSWINRRRPGELACVDAGGGTDQRGTLCGLSDNHQRLCRHLCPMERADGGQIRPALRVKPRQRRGI